MALENKIEIMLITYNRKGHLQKTLDTLLSEDSPIRQFDMTILDNASTDGTSEMLEEYAKKYPNLKHVRHKINIGGDANICRAFELGATSGKDYVWVLCDDDKYDFSNWSEVDQAIRGDADIICVADYVFPTPETKTDPAYQIFQLTFVPAGIYKVNLFTDTVLTNMYNGIYTCFQQSCATLNAINKGKKIHVLSQPVVFNGLHFEDKVSDVSLTRGSDRSEALPRRRDTLWVLGYSNIVGLLKDTDLQHRCLDVAIPYKDIYGSWDNFYHCLRNDYLNEAKLNYFYEVYKALPLTRQEEFLQRYKIERLKYFIQALFSIKNSHDKKHKIVKILGLSLKFKRRKNESQS